MLYCKSEWIHLGLQACMVIFIVQDRPLCLLQVYALIAKSALEAFVNKVNDTLLQV